MANTFHINLYNTAALMPSVVTKHISHITLQHSCFDAQCCNKHILYNTAALMPSVVTKHILYNTAALMPSVVTNIYSTTQLL